MTHISLPSPAMPALGDPHRELPRLLHRQLGGLTRAHLDSSALADAVVCGDVAIDPLVLPWRPAVGDEFLDVLLGEDDRRFESDAHRLLKVHARLLALALDPAALLEPEAAATAERHPLRADLVAWSAYGLSQSFECGATDGRSVLAQLEHGQTRVTVLPFADLALPAIVGYGFRRAANPPPPVLTRYAGERAWSALLARATHRGLALQPPGGRGVS